MQNAGTMQAGKLGRGTGVVVVAFLAVWLVALTWASTHEMLSTQGLNAPPVIAGVMLVVVMAMYASWPALRSWLAEVGVRRLTALHVLRATATPLFLWYGAHGLLPKVFADRAGWGDLIAAVAALIAVTVWRRPAGYWFAQLVGIADFFEAFATAIPLGRSGLQAMMHAIVSPPLVFIPCFLVVLFFAAHLIVVHQLLRGAEVHGRPA